MHIMQTLLNCRFYFYCLWVPFGVFGALSAPFGPFRSLSAPFGPIQPLSVFSETPTSVLV